MAHNFQGYDGYFIQQYLHENGVIPDVIMCGAKILSMYVPMLKIKFIDSLSFIPMRLADFPKTFGLTELVKGYFPHLFNKRENRDYVGPLPPSPYYYPDGMSFPDREKFMEWHSKLRADNYVFNFQEEILTYCRSDVDIVCHCCLEFRELFRDITNIDLFEKCLTIASACNLVFRTNFLKENTIAILPPHGYHPGTKQSNIALKWLSYTAERNDIYIQHKRNGGEKTVGHYSLDGYNGETQTAYELYGCFWHGKSFLLFERKGNQLTIIPFSRSFFPSVGGICFKPLCVVFFPTGCLNCYARDTVNKVNGKTMHDLYQATVQKTAYLREHGFNVIEMWECEINRELGHDEDMQRYFDDYDITDPLEPRHAFYGGRTNAAKLFHECKEGEEIRYVWKVCVILGAGL